MYDIGILKNPHSLLVQAQAALFAIAFHGLAGGPAAGYAGFKAAGDLLRLAENADGVLVELEFFFRYFFHGLVPCLPIVIVNQHATSVAQRHVSVHCAVRVHAHVSVRVPPETSAGVSKSRMVVFESCSLFLRFMSIQDVFHVVKDYATYSRGPQSIEQVFQRFRRGTEALSGP